MQAIGGYMELALDKGDMHYHDTPYTLKNARSSLFYILQTVRPAMVYIPFYTCSASLEPFTAAGVPYRFYALNEQMEPAELPELGNGEYFLYVNYFDLKRDVVAMLSDKYRDRFIADCAQAFFMKGNGMSWFFNSCRKFFGVPDGSYLYAPDGIILPEIPGKNVTYITEHLVKRFNGATQEGYAFFLENEQLMDCSITGMSLLSEYLLSHVHYEEVAEIRKRNYSHLHEYMEHQNGYPAAAGTDGVPMFYPFMPSRHADKSSLFTRQIYIPTLWQELMNDDVNGFRFEKNLAKQLWPLPVDQRYTADDMDRLGGAITDEIKEVR